MFVSDVVETACDSEVIQYANDTQFIHSGTLDTLPRLTTQAQATFTRAKAYSNDNGLMLNSNKTQCLLVGTRPMIKRTPENTTKIL